VGRADVCSRSGTRLLHGLHPWGSIAILPFPDRLPIPRSRSVLPPRMALIGAAAHIAASFAIAGDPLIAVRRAASRWRIGRPRCATLWPAQPQASFLAVSRAELPEDGSVVERSRRIGFASLLLFRRYKRDFLSPGYQDNLGWAFATCARRPQRAATCPSFHRGDGASSYSNELATARRHRIALTTVVFNDGAFGNVRRIQRQYGNRLIAHELATRTL